MRKTHKTIATILTAIMSITIFTCTAAASEAVSQETVKEVQQVLNDAGFDCGTPDGVAGNKTSEAIIEYQRSQGLEENGVITDELLASLGIVSAAEDLTGNEHSPGSDVDFPAAEQMSEDLYAGKWVKIGDQYEIWVPEAMDAAPIYDYIEISQRHASLLYGRVDTQKPEIVLLVGTIEEYLGENPIEGTKVTTEDINAWLAEIQEDESYSDITVNGIRGYYGESEIMGQGHITFISADPSCDIVITCVDENLDENGFVNNNGCWSENGHEYCMNMLLSFRKADAVAAKPEEVAETVTESVEEDTNTSESTPAEQTVSSEAAVSTTPPAEWEEITLDGQYDGTTISGNKFKWYTDQKVIYYDGSKVYGIVIDDGKVKVVRFAEDGESFVWEEVEDTVEDLAELGEYMYGLFTLHISWAVQMVPEVPKDAAVSEVLMNQKFTAPEDYSKESERIAINSQDGNYTGVTEDGNEFFWYNDRKVIFYDGPRVYGIIPIDNDLKLVRFSEDWNTYYWEYPLTRNYTFLTSTGECMYQLFVKRIEMYDEAN